MAALNAGITLPGQGDRGTVWKILGQTYYLKEVCDTSFAFEVGRQRIGPLYRRVTRLGTMQDFGDVIPASSVNVAYVRPISYETTGCRKFPEQANEGEPFAIEARVSPAARRVMFLRLAGVALRAISRAAETCLCG